MRHATRHLHDPMKAPVMTRAGLPPAAPRARGFTLVEVLVASLILALALIALSSLFALGIKNNAVAKEDTVMAAFAQDKLEDLKRQPLSTLQSWFDNGCAGPCVAGCVCGSPGCDAATCCTDICYPRGCAAVDRTKVFFEDPIPDPNPQDEVRESLYVREWRIQRVTLGQPVGCVVKITVLVGSRNGILAPKPDPPATNWINATRAAVLSNKNPRRVVISTYRAR